MSNNIFKINAETTTLKKKKKKQDIKMNFLFINNQCRYHLNISAKTAMTVLAVAFFQLGIIHGKSIKSNCTHSDEFFYAMPGTKCKSYYKCNPDKTMINIECQPGSVFDFYKQSCSRTAGICYEPVCVGRIDGIYQDTTHACRRAYICKGGYLDTIDNCPYGQLHNGRICEAQDNVICELPQTTSIAYPYSGDKRCLGITDGSHVAENTNCRRFVVCKANEVISDIECAENYRFHNDQHQCVPQHHIQSCIDNNDKKLCKGLRNGLHIDPVSIDCQSFIKCHNGDFISREYCGSLAVFNGSVCVPRPLYQCPTNPHTPDICRKKPNGHLSDPRRGCQTYVKCLAGKTIEQSQCPSLHYFDPHLKTCIFERSENNWKCRISPSNECAQLEFGYYQDKTNKSNCRNYYFCYNGKRTNFKCPSGTIFDGDACVKSDTYICPNLNPNSCANRPNGYYKDERAGCRAYFYCSGGSKFRYLCNEQQYFNGTMCIQRHAGHICNNVSDVCSGKNDGYYPDLNSRCRKYIFCLKEELLTTITCHGSKIYNGQKCVPINMYSCPSTDNIEDINCIPKSTCRSSDECKKSGFYADIDSGCVKYHFCIGNKKSVLSCKEGFLFNGEVCVSQHQYSCPKYCRSQTSDRCDR